MSAKENARQAWKEILGVVGVDADKEEENQGIGAVLSEEAPDTDLSFKGRRDVQVYQASVIADGMSLNGDAKVQGDLELRGTMKGNITADGNVTITGKLLGDLYCSKDVILISAAVQGNIAAKGVISLDKASTIIGDVEASNAAIDGKMKGSLTVEEAVSLQKDALLVGDVAAGRISMSEGEQVVGTLNINVDQVSSVEFKDIEL